MDISECISLCPSCLKNVGKEKEICPICQSPLSLENRPHQLAAGSALNGKYYIGKALGESPLSISYIGLDLTKNQKVIIKEFFPKENTSRHEDGYTVVPNDENADGEYSFDTKKTRFIERINNLAFFRRYKGIVNLLDKFEENDTFYKVMEFTKGVSLSKVYENNKPFLPDDLLDILEPVFMVTDAFNTERILHGAISPENIIVTDEGAMLLDLAEDLELCKKEAVSSSYYAPEYFMDWEEIASQADIYSLAAVYYKGITGITPPLSQVRIKGDILELPSIISKKININLESVMLKGLSVNPRKRYDKASRFYDDLVSAILNRK